MQKVTLPTGGTISFTYHWNSQYLPHISYVDTKTVSFSDPETGATVNEPFTYDITGMNAICTTVIKPEAATSQQKWEYCSHPALGTWGQFGGRTYKVTRPDGTTDETFWALNNAAGGGGPNPYVVRELHSAPGSSTLFSAKDYQVDINGNIRVVKEYDYGTGPARATAEPQILSPLATGTMQLKRTTKTEYDYDTGSLTPFPLDNSTPDPPDGYWRTLASNLRAPKSVEVLGVGNVRQAYTTYEYQYDTVHQSEGYRASANVTKEYRWDDTRGSYSSTLVACPTASCNAVMIERAYNLTGDVTDEWDADRHQTHYVYGSAGLAFPLKHPYPTKMYEAFGVPADVREWTFEWDASTGVRTSETDENNAGTTNAEYDGRGRITLLTEGPTSERRKTRTTYTDPGPSPSSTSMTVQVESDFSSAGDFALSSTTHFDGLARAWKTVDDRLGIQTYTFTRAWPAQNAVLTLVSNPFPVSGNTDPTAGWTLTKTDVNGRAVAVASYIGSAKPDVWPSGTNSSGSGTSTTAYTAGSLGAMQTVTDQDSKTRTLYTDGLGRLTRVKEAGSIDTVYTYNALDNLIGVDQSGQTRTFTYSSLGRLTTAANPEYCGVTTCGTMSYEYSYAGNLVKRTDPRGVITCFGVLTASTCNGSGYNARSQPTRKQYSDSTTTVTYTYDDCTYGRGRLCKTDNGLSQTEYTYDGFGRVKTSKQTTDSVPYNPFEYTYKLSGAVESMKYPSLNMVTYGFDVGGRINRVAKGALSSNSSYATNIQYAPHGGLSSLNAGVTPTVPNGILETRQYNSRLQPTQIQIAGGLLTLAFGYNGSNNNGNVVSQDIYRDYPITGQPTFRFRYAYDEFNRLKIAAADPSQTLTASTTCSGITSTWCQQNWYDVWGNRAIGSFSGTAPDPTGNNEVPKNFSQQVANTPFLASNRIAAFGSNGYDAAGNVLNFAGVRHDVTYDAENRQTSVTSSNNERTDYAYDGDGRRVKKTVGVGTANPVTTIFLYDAAGQMAAEYGGPAPSETGTRYLFGDHLGSTRLVVKADGSEDNRYDYLPFGEELTGAGTVQGYPTSDTEVRGRQRLEFTSKERDAETGLDYFGARYFSSAQGRFTSPDEWAGGIVDAYSGGAVGVPGPLPYADITDPQTLNKYAYVRNNPMRYIDPTGHEIVGSGPNGEVVMEHNAVTNYVENAEAGLLVGATNFVVETINYNTDRVNRWFGTNIPKVSTLSTDKGNEVQAEWSKIGADVAVAMIPGPKEGKGPKRSMTEPTLPGKTIVKENGVTVEHYYRSGDHGPAHLHVSGEGPTTRIGQNGKPLSGDAELSPRQSQVVNDNKSTIRGAADKIMRWFRYNEQQ